MRTTFRPVRLAHLAAAAALAIPSMSASTADAPGGSRQAGVSSESSGDPVGAQRALQTITG